MKYLYCIKSPTFPNYYKVGFSKNPNGILKRYNSHNPNEDFEIVDLYPFDNPKTERDVLKALGAIRYCCGINTETYDKIYRYKEWVQKDGEEMKAVWLDCKNVYSLAKAK
jgi:DNA-directed RNA polymerase subunit N (RpoN/RPB10)